jgi:hypothetical protein
MPRGFSCRIYYLIFAAGFSGNSLIAEIPKNRLHRAAGQSHDAQGNHGEGLRLKVIFVPAAGTGR